MRLPHGRHLAYCTNVHRGEDWPETLGALEAHTLAVKERVCPPGEPFAIGLRLSDLASRQLAVPETLGLFRRWLDEHGCYVFTINGFPFGRFHGGRVKEQVFRPDWASPERLEYTCRLFDILARLLPAGVEGSVSTLPGSYKAFGSDRREIRRNIVRCAEHAAHAGEACGNRLTLGLEPEPLGLFENFTETLEFFDDLPREHIGVCFDTCHAAVEFESARGALEALRASGIRISKLHLSSALSVRPGPAVRERLRAFADDVYLHQVIARRATGELARYGDLESALSAEENAADEEWRIHFHIPLHCPSGGWFQTTAGELLGAMDWLASAGACNHLEMETYTWEVLPPELRSGSVVEQLAREYEWTLGHLRERGLA